MYEDNQFRCEDCMTLFKPYGRKCRVCNPSKPKGAKPMKLTLPLNANDLLDIELGKVEPKEAVRLLLAHVEQLDIELGMIEELEEDISGLEYTIAEQENTITALEGGN